jgi:endo-1,4-beta-xylanase
MCLIMQRMKFEFPPQKNFTRRTLLKAAAKISLLGASGLGLPACSMLGCIGDWCANGPGLGERARRQNKRYGTAVQSGQLDDAAFAAALRREAALLVPELELKWDVLRPSAHEFDFSGYRRLAAFAQEQNMAMRGHTLLWHRSNPKWLGPALHNRHAAEKILRTHIAQVIAETAPLVRDWDVVNEAVHPDSSRADGLRETLWLKALGPGYVAEAFRMAHVAGPQLTLVYNDYGFELDGAPARRKRQSTLRLLDRCLREKAPVHALGLQSHLEAHRPMARKEFGVFLENVRAMGLKIIITELDLNVTHLSGRSDDRVKIAQNYVRAHLDTVQEKGAVDMLLTWGLSDRYSWLKSAGMESTGALPLDRDLNRGPLWATLRDDWLKERPAKI